MPGCSYVAVHIGDRRSHVKKCKKAPGYAKRQAVRGVDGRPVALRPAAEMPEPDSLTQLLSLIDLLPRPAEQGPDLAPALPVPAEAQDPSVVWPLAQPAMPAAQAVPVPAPEAAPHAPGVVMLAPPPASVPPALLLPPTAFAVKAESEIL